MEKIVSFCFFLPIDIYIFYGEKIVYLEIPSWTQFRRFQFC